VPRPKDGGAVGDGQPRRSLLIFGGFILLAASWRVLFTAHRDHKLASTSSYASIRHPQDLAFITIRGSAS
jgi:hypothetical protein